MQCAYDDVTYERMSCQKRLGVMECLCHRIGGEEQQPADHRLPRWTSRGGFKGILAARGRNTGCRANGPTTIDACLSIIQEGHDRVISVQIR